MISAGSSSVSRSMPLAQITAGAPSGQDCRSAAVIARSDWAGTASSTAAAERRAAPASAVTVSASGIVWPAR